MLTHFPTSIQSNLAMPLINALDARVSGREKKGFACSGVVVCTYRERTGHCAISRLPTQRGKGRTASPVAAASENCADVELTAEDKAKLDRLAAVPMSPKLSFVVGEIHGYTNNVGDATSPASCVRASHAIVPRRNAAPAWRWSGGAPASPRIHRQPGTWHK